MSPEELRSIEASGQLYVLEAEFRYESDAFGLIVVPKGFTTDFASIPRPAFWYIDPEDPQILFPSVVHDYLYTRRGDLDRGSNLILSRKACDSCLREGMLSSGARRAQALVVFLAVRMGGGLHW